MGKILRRDTEVLIYSIMLLIVLWPRLCRSYKGLVAEALRQLVGEHGYKQDEVLPPGYYTGK